MDRAASHHKMRIVVGILLIIIIAAILYSSDVRAYSLIFFTWLDSLGPWAPVLFILIDMLVVVFVLPGVVLTLGAGFMFGVIKGSLYVVIATTIGATIAFLLARYIFSDRITHYLKSHPKARLLDQEFSHQGWKIVLLSRLVPFFPFKLSNYFFGLTHFSLRDFFFGTLIGIIPITMFNVYVGSLAADLATLGTEGAPKTPLQWTVYGIGFVITIIALVYITHLAKRALRNHLPDQKRL